MKAHYQFAGFLAVILILAFGLLYSARSVSAAAEGKITGTIKLDGTPPHQRPIDMSKEPVCQKEHAAHPVTTETVVTGPNNALQYVAVYISEGLPAAAASQASSETPTFDQKGCQYIPHVLAVDVNQHFKVTNSDPHSHNIHPWMSGYHVVVKGPYGTSDNNGAYTISNVPPGNYTLTAWQETYGAQTQKVTVSAGAPAKADFTFKAK